MSHAAMVGGLGLIGMAEAVVYLLRYRTAHHPSAAVSAAMTGMTAALRVLFVVVGAGAVMREAPVWVLVLAYVLPAAGVTWVFHAWLEGRKKTVPLSPRCAGPSPSRGEGGDQESVNIIQMPPAMPMAKMSTMPTASSSTEP